MSNPVIGYSNILESAISISASSEAAGYEKENCFDWLTYDFWKPTGFVSENITIDMANPVSADYWAICAHDAYTNGAQYFLRASTDNFSSSNIGIDSITPSSNGIIFRTFSSVSYRYWRIVIFGGSAATSIGMFSLGDRLDLPDGMQVGFIPPTLSYDDEVLNSTSQGGAFLGRSVIRQGARGRMQFDLMTPAWVRSDWQPFLEHARVKPFFLSWDPTNYPAEAAYCWSDGRIDAPYYSRPNYMTAAFDFRGIAS